MPKSFANAGALSGSITLICTTLITMYCNLLLIEAKKTVISLFDSNASVGSHGLNVSPRLSHLRKSPLLNPHKNDEVDYSKLASLALGQNGQIFVDIGTVAIHMGAASVYIDFVVSNFMNFITWIRPDQFQWLTIYHFYAIFSVVFISTALINKIHTVAKVASLGNDFLVLYSFDQLFGQLATKILIFLSLIYWNVVFYGIDLPNCNNYR